MAIPLRSNGASIASSSSRQYNGGIRQRYDGNHSTSYPPRVQTDYESKYSVNGKGKGKGRAKEEDGSSKVPSRRSRRAIIREAFRRFGEHCARNQIRTLLIDCLVMTNLFYPSLALYLSKKFPPLHAPSPPTHNTHRITPGHNPRQNRNKKEHPLSLLSTPILDSFFPYPPPLLPRLPWGEWWDSQSESVEGRDHLRSGGSPDIHGWSASAISPSSSSGTITGFGSIGNDDTEIRIARIGWADVGDVLDKQYGEEPSKVWLERDDILLDMVRKMAEDWETNSGNGGSRCIRHLIGSDSSKPGDDAGMAEANGECYIFVPSKIPPEDRNSTEVYHWRDGDGDVYHGVSALFEVPRNGVAEFDLRWTEAMTGIADAVEGEVFVEARASGVGPTGYKGSGQWLLSHTSSHTSPSHDSETLDQMDQSPPLTGRARWIVYTLYLVLLGFLGSQLSNASKVHSRFGLAFTGIVQLCCSAVMSFSVLALAGWNGWGSSSTPTTLPTYILPFVIVVVGAENMSTLTRAVFSIPFTYSVPVRIGLALSKVGTTISLTSLIDIAFLLTVWLFVNIRPVREFCVFAAVVIMVDWFMLHTFFLTILSIDAQRLELADVLASPNGAVTKQPEERKAEIDAELAKGFGWSSVVRARSARVGSLVLLLCSVGVIYYITERHRTAFSTTASLYGYKPSPASSLPNTPNPFITTASDLLSLSPSELLWRAINPLGFTSIRISIPPASILILPKAGHAMLPKDLRKLTVKTSRLLLPRLKPLFYLFKVVVLPQAVTAGALYILLLYLLKDAELLDAQRDRLGLGDDLKTKGKDIHEHDDNLGEMSSSQNRLAGSLEVHILPNSHGSDIDVLATSIDGSMAISVGIDNTICLWRFSETAGTGTREVLSLAKEHSGEAVLGAGISLDKKFVALHSTWDIYVWELRDEAAAVLKPVELAVQKQHQEGRKIYGVRFTVKSGIDDPFIQSGDNGNGDSTVSYNLLVLYSDGSIDVLADRAKKRLLPPSDRQESVRFIFVGGSDDQSEAGSLSMVRTAGSSLVEWYKDIMNGDPPIIVQPDLTDGDRIVCAATMVIDREDTRYLLALGHRNGIIEIFDDSGNLITVIGQPGNPSIRNIHLSSSTTSSRCTGCQSLLGEGFWVISQTRISTMIDRLTPKGVSLCRCPRPTTSRSTSNEEIPTLRRIGVSPTWQEKNPSLVIPPSAKRGSQGNENNSPLKSPSLVPPVSNGEFPLSSHGVRRHSNIHRDESGFRPPSPLTADSLTSGSNTTTNLLLSPASAHGSIIPIPGTSTSTSSNLNSPATFTSPIIPRASPPSDWNLSEGVHIHNLGGISSMNGGAVYLKSQNLLIGLRRSSSGIDDAGWQIFTIDFQSPWNGSLQTLNVGSTNLSARITETRRSIIHGQEISMKDRRAERLLSLSGRSPFGSTSISGGGGGSSTRSSITGNGSGSFIGALNQGLIGYIEIGPIEVLGKNSILVGLGNRLGMISLPEEFVTKRMSSGNSQRDGGGGMGHSRRGSAAGPAGKGIGLTPPPPKRNEVSESRKVS